MRKLTNKLKEITPLLLWNFYRSLYYGIIEIIQNIGPSVRTRCYCGIKLYYNKNNAIIKRLKKEMIFEKKMCDIVVKELINKQKGDNEMMFLDIGANIGLVSAYVISRMPQITIHAFEPGLNQREFLVKTVENNSLKNIHVHSEALGDKVGVATFYAHDAKYAAFDGFKDTKRRGRTKAVEVSVNSLDSWWVSAGKPNVPVVKIDTEGAELLVLTGAEKFINEVKPTIFLEIESSNLKAYPYDEFKIVEWFSGHKYNLFTLDGIMVDRENINKLIGSEDVYIARPEILLI